jgi:flagellin-specific chaperone FliS
MTLRLTEANIRQEDGPLAEAESLLATLSQAWEEARAKQVPGQQPETPAAPAPVWQETNLEPAAHGWSA